MSGANISTNCASVASHCVRQSRNSNFLSLATNGTCVSTLTCFCTSRSNGFGYITKGVAESGNFFRFYKSSVTNGALFTSGATSGGTCRINCGDFFGSMINNVDFFGLGIAACKTCQCLFALCCASRSGCYFFFVIMTGCGNFFLFDEYNTASCAELSGCETSFGASGILAINILNVVAESRNNLFCVCLTFVTNSAVCAANYACFGAGCFLSVYFAFCIVTGSVDSSFCCCFAVFTNSAVCTANYTCFGASGSLSVYFAVCVVAESINNFLFNKNFAANGALLTFGKTCFGTGCALSGKDFFNVFCAKIVSTNIALVIAVFILVAKSGNGCFCFCFACVTSSTVSATNYTSFGASGSLSVYFAVCVVSERFNNSFCCCFAFVTSSTVGATNYTCFGASGSFSGDYAVCVVAESLKLFGFGFTTFALKGLFTLFGASSLFGYGTCIKHVLMRRVGSGGFLRSRFLGSSSFGSGFLRLTNLTGGNGEHQGNGKNHDQNAKNVLVFHLENLHKKFGASLHGNIIS